MKKSLLIMIVALLFASHYLAAQQKRYQGRPRFRAGMTRRFVIWEEGGVFRLRTTTKQLAVKFTDAIFAPGGQFSNVRLIRRDRGDYAKLSRDKKKLYFSFTTKKGVDGLNFTTTSQRVPMFLFINRKKARKKLEIFLGAKGAHPLNNPLILFVSGSGGNDADPGITQADLKEEGEEITSVVSEADLEPESKTSD